MTSGELRLPPGFRFHPTDDESGPPLPLPAGNAPPSRLSSLSSPRSTDTSLILCSFQFLVQSWRCTGRKSGTFIAEGPEIPNGSRTNRAAGDGYWKATATDKPIGNPKALRIKKALVFYAGKAPKGIKTNWIMREYRLANVDLSAGT